MWTREVKLRSLADPSAVTLDDVGKKGDIGKLQARRRRAIQDDGTGGRERRPSLVTDRRASAARRSNLI